jgi:(1->4)-alpha-D-glucan 1-alpha-D-glucosylmutase
MRVLASKDDRLKLFATAHMLRARRTLRDVFEGGAYEPLSALGAARDHVFAFARTLGDFHVLVVVPRLVATLAPDAGVPPLGERVWGDTKVVLPPRLGAPDAYHHVLTDRCVKVRSVEGTDSSSLPHGTVTVHAADVFEHFPIAMLTSTKA